MTDKDTQGNPDTTDSLDEATITPQTSEQDNQGSGDALESTSTESLEQSGDTERTTATEASAADASGSVDTPVGDDGGEDSPVGPVGDADDQPVGQASGDSPTAPAADPQTSSSEQSTEKDTSVKEEVEQPTPVTSEETAATAVTVDKVAPVVEGVTAFSDDLAIDVNALLLVGSPMTRITLMELLDYVRELAPGNPVDETRGKQLQLKLYASLQNIINSGAADFDDFFGVFLRMVHELKEAHVFNERYFSRFITSFSLGEVERASYIKLIDALKAIDFTASRAEAVIPDDALVFLSVEGQERIKKHFAA